MSVTNICTLAMMSRLLPELTSRRHAETCATLAIISQGNYALDGQVDGKGPLLSAVITL